MANTSKLPHEQEEEQYLKKQGDRRVVIPLTFTIADWRKLKDKIKEILK